MSNITLVVTVKNTAQLIATTQIQEKYSLALRENNTKWELNADYYAGFLRGIETFSQLFEKSTN